MAEIRGGLGCSHAPSIGQVFDQGLTQEPGWKPLFDALDHAGRWLLSLDVDALVVIYNDHIDQYQLEAWPQFAIGVGKDFAVADEGWLPRKLPVVPGYPELAMHIASALVSSGIDISVAYEQVVDHGILSPLPLINRGWAMPIVPVEINVIFDPRPSPARCWDLGNALGKAIESFNRDVKVAVIGTGGLSHQLTGPEFGVVRPEWDREFLRLIQDDPASLTSYRTEDFARLGGEHSVEIVQWMTMRASLPPGFSSKFAFYYPYEIMGYGIVGFSPG
ncbi:MAG: protocatechuate 3,4-dioxygenase [Acidimicrobiales bacterium]